MGWYARLVTSYPWTVIIADIVVVLICGPIAIWQAGIPDFSDPNTGYEPRGTLIRGWELANTKLMARIYSGNLSYFPGESPETGDGEDGVNPQLADTSTSTGDIWSTMSTGDTGETTQSTIGGCQPEELEGVTTLVLPPALQVGTKLPESKALPRLVVQPKDASQSLWSPEYMKAICDIENTYILSPLDRSCHAHSLPYYIGLTIDKSCGELTQKDLDDFMSLLKDCSVHYFSNDLVPAQVSSFSSCTADDDPTNLCVGVNKTQIPDKCTHYNAVYNTLHFLSDVDFIAESSSQTLVEAPVLSYTQIIYRRSWQVGEDELYDYYLETLVEKTLENDLVEVKAMDMNLIEREVSRYYIFNDLPLYGLAMALVIVVLFLYLRSFALMLAVLLNVGLSLFVAYFLYHVVCRFTYFGFTNLLAGLLLIAVGADDVFIFFDIWHKVKHGLPESDPVKNLEEVTSHTLRHATLSILVTSLTTAAALFANGISDIIALRCFGIFGGICVLVNLFFMVTLIPAILVLMEKAVRKYPKICSCSWANKCTKFFAKLSNFMWNMAVPNVVIKVWPLWLICLLGLGIYGFVAVFYQPKLELPQTERIQQYYSEHPFEVYKFQMHDRFRFEIENTERSRVKMSLNFVFGVEGEDNGDIFDPDDQGVLKFDPHFEISSRISQIWLHRFCRNLLKDDFISLPDQYMCFSELFERIATSPCSYNQLNITVNPLCCSTNFPLPEEDAKLCLQDVDLVRLVHILSDNKSLIGAPVYDMDQSIKATVFTVETKQKWSALYSVMDPFYNHFYSFVVDELEDAPDGVKRGWFTGSQGSELYFYDLQRSMVQGVISGIGLAMGIAFLVMLVTSMNFFITAYAILTIVFVITVTIGILVHLGWSLGVSEALVITLTIGLSIDFTIHFGVAYKISSHQDRKSRVRDAISVVGFAVTMAALTTFLAGAALISGRVLSFYRFGLFLMLDMAVSWVYAVFFFLPLCLFIGPVGRVGELGELICCGKRRTTETEEVVVVSNGNINSAFNSPSLSKDGQLRDKNSCDKHDISVQVSPASHVCYYY